MEEEKVQETKIDLAKMAVDLKNWDKIKNKKFND